jgi:hypothetical protein
MAMQQKARQTIRGEVESVNDKGARIAGTWYNYSRYHDVPHPYEDELVALTVAEGSKWIEALTVLEDSKGCTVLHQPAPNSSPAPDMPLERTRTATQPRTCRDLTIRSWLC